MNKKFTPIHYSQMAMIALLVVVMVFLDATPSLAIGETHTPTARN